MVPVQVVLISDMIPDQIYEGEEARGDAEGKER